MSQSILIKKDKIFLIHLLHAFGHVMYFLKALRKEQKKPFQK